MAKKRIIDLPNLESGSVNTILVGHDNGTTYQIKLNVLTASVVEMLSQSTDVRLDFLEQFQNDFYLISASIDTKIAAATNEQSLAHLVTTSSLNTFTQSYQTDSASFTQRIIDATNEQDLSYLATTQSINDLSTSVDSRLNTLESFSSSADNRYVLSGSITQTTWDNIANKPNDIVSSSTQISDLGYATTSSVTIISSSVSRVFESASFYSSSLATSISASEAEYTSFSASLQSTITNISTSVDSRLDTLEASASSDYINVKYSSFEPGIPTSGSAYKFDATPQGNIIYDNTTGYFNLIAGKIYNLYASVGLRQGSEIIYQWYDATNNQHLGVQGGMFKVGSTSDALNHSSIANAIITPTTNINVYLRSIYRDSSNNRLQDLQTFAEIRQIGKSEVVNNIYNYVSSSVYQLDSASFNSRIISGSAVAGTISSSAQISAFGFISTSTQIPTGTISSSTQITNLGFVSGTYETTGRNIVSSSSQLTSSFDTRYAISASFVSSSNLSSIRTITSASYAALTPISGTLYIIIG